MSDCILFASLFAMHIVLSKHLNITVFDDHNNSIFNLNFIFSETVLLLLSSLACCKSMFYINKTWAQKFMQWICITELLGLCFIILEIYEFFHLIHHGYTPCYNAFFSSFFILIGTHGIHVIVGLIWIIIMIIQLTLNGLTQTNLIRLQCLSLFWHFLDIVWICVFTIVYLIGIL
nr:cytochrome c oxidase subunit 3 [Candidatus Blochmannia vafer]